MARQTTDRLKFNPPLGRMPVLQFVLPQELQIDESYQRSIEADDSQRLIRQIAQHWDWDLCQPLMVSRRRDGALFVIDGQHRLAAARLRADIAQLPAMVKEYASAADEAASFVHLNQRRRPLTALQLFRAAVASGDSEARAILAAIEAAGLRLGKSSQLYTSPPGSIIHINGIREAWRRHGAAVCCTALHVLATAFAGQRLIYAGTIWPGIVALVADGGAQRGYLQPEQTKRLCAVLGARDQQAWRAAILRAKADDAALTMASAGALVIGAALAGDSGLPVTAEPRAVVAHAPRPMAIEAPRMPAASAGESAKRWCDQCDRQVTGAEARSCSSRFCRAKAAA